MTQSFAKKHVLILAASISLVLAATFVSDGRGVKPRPATCQSQEGKSPDQLLDDALLLAETGDHDLAGERLSRARRLWTLSGEHEKAARAFLLVGDSFRRMKRFRESLSYFAQALEIRPLSSQSKAIAFKCIAKVYAELYNFDLSRRYFTNSISEARKAKDISSQAEALSGLATLCYRSGERERALVYVEQARQLNTRQGDDELEAMLLHLTGKIAREQGLRDKSQKALDAALAIYRRTDNEGEQVKVLCSIADLNLSSAQNEAALERAQEAVKLGETKARHSINEFYVRKSREWRWRAFLALARAQRAMGQGKAASRSYNFAVSHLEAIWLRTTTATDVGAVAFGEERQVPYRELVDLLMEQEDLSESYYVAEQARSRTILSMIATRHRKGSSKREGQSEILRASFKSIASLRTQLFSPGISPAQRARIEREIEESEFALQEAKAKLDMERSRDRLGWAEPASVKDVQAGLSRGSECVVEFLLGEKRSFVWLIFSDRQFVEVLPPRQELEKEVGRYLEAIGTKPNNLYLERQLDIQKGLSEKLFNRLFGRLAGQFTPGNKLILVPDGILHYLPFEALIHKGRYLLEDHEISYLPSASLLGLLRNSKTRTETGDKMDLLAFGDPIFLSNASVGGGERVLRTSEGFQLSALPGTREEVQQIAKLFEPGHSRVYLQKESTEDAVKSESLRRYRRLHFATHGLAYEQNPSRSAVVLTLDRDPGEDGFLEVGEIAELDLDCDLVVLSACQTGRGQLLSGEGIVGLSRAFLYAGARSVVVTLWNVSDISTSHLMKGFYQNLVRGDSNAAALREAKLQMIRKGRETQSPYYWASFIIIGKP